MEGIERGLYQLKITPTGNETAKIDKYDDNTILLIIEKHLNWFLTMIHTIKFVIYNYLVIIVDA